MSRSGLVAVALVALLNGLPGHAQGANEVFPLRWFYVSNGLGKEEDVAKVCGLAETAAAHGLNGMVLTGGFDTIDLQPPEYLDRLARVRARCEALGVEIIPIIFSAGYGGGILAHNMNLAAGLPVTDALYVVQGRQAIFQPDPPVAIVNGGCEEAGGDRLVGYAFHDRPGEISFVDREVKHSGAASLRFEHFGELDPANGHGRLMQELTVAPHRCYRVSCWLRTEGLRPTSGLALQVYGEDDALISTPAAMAETEDWKQVSLLLNSANHSRLRIYVGMWGGKAGRFWVDDLEIQELGLANVLRRPGTPITVRGEDGTAYEEGRDHERIAAGGWREKPPTESGALTIAAGSRIQDGARLRVSYYHWLPVQDGQIGICMSEPEVYEIWTRVAALIHQHVAPQHYLLSMDEIREGGSCAACRARHLTMGEILGDCITRQMGILRASNPQAEVLCWSDMLDPNHNCHGNYYLVEGDFTGAREHVPKDLIMACWYYEKRDQTLPFFSGLGSRTLGGAYYDADDLENPKGWLESLRRTPGALGIMYTTWQDKYELLGPFGDLVSRP